VSKFVDATCCAILAKRGFLILSVTKVLLPPWFSRNKNTVSLNMVKRKSRVRAYTYMIFASLACFWNEENMEFSRASWKALTRETFQDSSLFPSLDTPPHDASSSISIA